MDQILKKGIDIRSRARKYNGSLLLLEMGHSSDSQSLAVLLKTSQLHSKHSLKTSRADRDGVWELETHGSYSHTIISDIVDFTHINAFAAITSGIFWLPHLNLQLSVACP